MESDLDVSDKEEAHLLPLVYQLLEITETPERLVCLFRYASDDINTDGVLGCLVQERKSPIKISSQWCRVTVVLFEEKYFTVNQFIVRILNYHSKKPILQMWSVDKLQVESQSMSSCMRNSFGKL